MKWGNNPDMKNATLWATFFVSGLRKEHPRHEERNPVVAFLVPGSRGMRKHARHEECDHAVTFFMSGW